MAILTRVPTYRKHRQSGQAVVTLPDGLGGRKDVLLGKHGTKQSRMEYARVITEWEAAGRRLPQIPTAADLTVNELIIEKSPRIHFPHLDNLRNTHYNF